MYSAVVLLMSREVYEHSIVLIKQLGVNPRIPVDSLLWLRKGGTMLVRDPFTHVIMSVFPSVEVYALKLS